MKETTLYSGVNLKSESFGGATKLENVVFKGKVKFNSGRIFGGCSALSEKSISDIIENGNLKTEAFLWSHFNCNIVFPENTNINEVLWLFYLYSDNKSDIIIKDNSKISGNGLYAVIEVEQAGVVINNVTIGNNCELYALFNGSWHYAWKNPTIKNIKIGNNNKLSSRNFSKVNVENVEIGKSCEMNGATFENCTISEDGKFTIYLTDEQKNDHTKISRVWQNGIKNVKEWTETIDNEKAVWTVKELNS